jgi:hypothetical protein
MTLDDFELAFRRIVAKFQYKDDDRIVAATVMKLVHEAGMAGLPWDDCWAILVKIDVEQES